MRERTDIRVRGTRKSHAWVTGAVISTIEVSPWKRLQDRFNFYTGEGDKQEHKGPVFYPSSKTRVALIL